MKKNKVVSAEDWVASRKKLLAKEKEFNRLRDELSRERQSLPWVRVEKKYIFDTAAGKKSLSDLFKDKSQLLIYHFMFGPDWEEGCPSCSFVADNFMGIPIHMSNRDVSFVVVSRAPLEKINQFKKRMGWDFDWVSSYETDFNYDYQVSFKKEDLEKKEVYYNYQTTTFPADEGPGASVFVKYEDEVFHTYSTYARGLDMFLTAYHYLDLVPKGRDEKDLPWTMAWLRHHDKYDNAPNKSLEETFKTKKKCH